MPNDLTQTYSRSVPRQTAKKASKKNKKIQDELLSPSQDEQLSSMEQIRQDLDDADNVFGVFYRNKPLKKRANSFDNQDSRLQSRDDGDEYSEGPSVEWLPSSGSERDKCDIDEKLVSLRDQDGRICDDSEILNMTGVRDLKQMEKARENLDQKSKVQPENGQLVLDKQILDIKIQQKIKMVRSSQI